MQLEFCSYNIWFHCVDIKLVHSLYQLCWIKNQLLIDTFRLSRKEQSWREIRKRNCWRSLSLSMEKMTLTSHQITNATMEKELVINENSRKWKMGGNYKSKFNESENIDIEKSLTSWFLNPSSVNWEEGNLKLLHTHTIG